MADTSSSEYNSLNNHTTDNIDQSNLSMLLTSLDIKQWSISHLTTNVEQKPKNLNKNTFSNGAREYIDFNKRPESWLPLVSIDTNYMPLPYINRALTYDTSTIFYYTSEAFLNPDHYNDDSDEQTLTQYRVFVNYEKYFNNDCHDNMDEVFAPSEIHRHIYSNIDYFYTMDCAGYYDISRTPDECRNDDILNSKKYNYGTLCNKCYWEGRARVGDFKPKDILYGWCVECWGLFDKSNKTKYLFLMNKNISIQHMLKFPHRIEIIESQTSNIDDIECALKEYQEMYNDQQQFYKTSSLDIQKLKQELEAKESRLGVLIQQKIQPPHKLDDILSSILFKKNIEQQRADRLAKEQEARYHIEQLKIKQAEFDKQQEALNSQLQQAVAKLDSLVSE